MKTTLILMSVAALATTLFALQPSPNGPTQSCCGEMSSMQHDGDRAQKPVVANEVRGVQKATILIENGAYNPAAIQVAKGKPVELTFKGGKNIGCGGTVVFKSLKINREVTTGKSVVVKFTPKEAGEIPFTCDMGMMKGKVIVN